MQRLDILWLKSRAYVRCPRSGEVNEVWVCERECKAFFRACETGKRSKCLIGVDCDYDPRQRPLLQGEQA